MCFDDEKTYTTKTYIANGHRYSSEYTRPSWRRRHGFGGRYYPARYYDERPSGRYLDGDMAYSNRHSNCAGPQGGRYGRYAQGGRYGGYPQHGNYARGVMPGGYAAYGADYGRNYPGAQIEMPHQAVSVSFALSSSLRLRCLVPALLHTAFPILIGSRGFSIAARTSDSIAPTPLLCLRGCLSH
jgi:hypothetical protein